jgi:hypothetical protein
MKYDLVCLIKCLMFSLMEGGRETAERNGGGQWASFSALVSPGASPELARLWQGEIEPRTRNQALQLGNLEMSFSWDRVNLASVNSFNDF